MLNKLGGSEQLGIRLQVMLFLEFEFEKSLNRKLARGLAVLLLSGALSCCVTTTTGGFMVDASEEQAATDYIQLALAYFDNRDMPAARRHVNNALDIDNRISDAYMVLAMISQHEGDLDLADSNYQRAISLDKDNSSARNNYAAMLFSQERFRESYEQLERVANDTSYEGRSLVFEGLGRSALRLGRQEEAKAAFQRALQLNENLFICEKDLKKKINKKTLAVVTTNIFNSFNDSKKIKNLCNSKKVPLIEDNAIYFGNFKKIGNKKIYAGSFGDYSLNSFNIMKNISAMYGGSIETNDKKFAEFANRELNLYKKFPPIKFLMQSIIFLILKTLSIRPIYKLFFFNLLKKAYTQNNLFILSLVYPSLKFKKRSLPDYYFTKMNYISKNMIYFQINDVENFNINHIAKKNNNIYYTKVFKNKKIRDIKVLKNKDPNFQNYNDFPIFVNKKKYLVNYLFSKGIETKTIQYVDCQKIFKSYKNHKNSRNYENEIICLPNHKKITQKYINYVVSCIDMFYKNL